MVLQTPAPRTPRGGQLRLDATELLRAMAIRGLLAQDLCRLAGIAEPTLSGALRGRPVTGTTIGRLARALAETPPIALEGIDRLVRVTSVPGQPGSTTENTAGGSTPTVLEKIGDEAAQLQPPE
ncbi:MAG: helix-turn-helix domain-containing protein [Candidatus Dormibacteria bacterium]